MSPSTGTEYSAALRCELARSSSAVSQRRAAMSWVSSFGGTDADMGELSASAEEGGGLSRFSRLVDLLGAGRRTSSLLFIRGPPVLQRLPFRFLRRLPRRCDP